MTRLRLTIAKRLKEAQNNAAMLTTFNEVDMSSIMEIRKNYQEEFQKKYSVKLGFMSFFVPVLDFVCFFPCFFLIMMCWVLNRIWN